MLTFRENCLGKSYLKKVIFKWKWHSIKVCRFKKHLIEDLINAIHFISCRFKVVMKNVIFRFIFSSSWCQNCVAFNMMWWFIGEKMGGKNLRFFFSTSFFLKWDKKYAALYCCHNWFQFLMVPSLLSSVQFIFSSHHMNWAWENKEVMLMQKRILKRDFSEGNLRVCMTGQGRL